MEIIIKEPPKQPKRKMRVCAYCRVSSDHEEQATSVKNQKNYYKRIIAENPQYEFAGIYCDSGISGRCEKRPEFQRMLEDARLGKIDLILTKSISRFARDTNTMLKAVRELQELQIGVFFELQSMNTLNMEGELFLTIYAAFAQAESENTSELLSMAHLRRARNGDHSACLSGLYGYSKTSEGEFYPDEDARWVEKIFQLAADGLSPTDIAKYLNRNKVKPKVTKKFTGTVVMKIIRNPSYMGMIVRSRYYLDDDGKVKKNDGTHYPLTIENHHEPIVTRSMWENAQMRLPIESAAKGIKNRMVSMEDLRKKCQKYKGRLYCAECGYALHGSVSTRENVVYFHCYGNGRFGKGFCKVNTIPLYAVKEFGDFQGNIYVRSETDEYGHRTFQYESEVEWKSHSQKKPPLKIIRDMETAYLEGRLFCEKCKSKLLRRSTSHQKNIWICEGNKRHGKDYCDGIAVPDQYLKGTEFTQSKIYIEERFANEEKHYYYSTKGGKVKKLHGIR